MSDLQTKNKIITRESFGRELYLDVVSENGEWLDNFMVIWELDGIKYSPLKKKLDEVVRLDDITFNWKLAGSRSSQITTCLRYEPIEVIQLNQRTYYVISGSYLTTSVAPFVDTELGIVALWGLVLTDIYVLARLTPPPSTPTIS